MRVTTTKKQEQILRLFNPLMLVITESHKHLNFGMGFYNLIFACTTNQKKAKRLGFNISALNEKTYIKQIEKLFDYEKNEDLKKYPEQLEKYLEIRIDNFLQYVENDFGATKRVYISSLINRSKSNKSFANQINYNEDSFYLFKYSVIMRNFFTSESTPEGSTFYNDIKNKADLNERAFLYFSKSN